MPGPVEDVVEMDVNMMEQSQGIATPICDELKENLWLDALLFAGRNFRFRDDEITVANALFGPRKCHRMNVYLYDNDARKKNTNEKIGEQRVLPRGPCLCQNDQQMSGVQKGTNVRNRINIQHPAELLQGRDPTQSKIVVVRYRIFDDDRQHHVPTELGQM